MCGASDQQKAVWAQDSSFSQDLSRDYSTVFGESQAILGELKGGLEPIFAAGPNQRGFSDQERAVYNTQAAEAASRTYSKVSEAVGAAEAGRGGDTVVPSGQDAALQARLATASSAERNTLEQKVITADYDTGRQNWEYAGEGLGKVAQAYNPLGYADAANGANRNAEQAANDIANADNSIWGIAAGALTGVAGAAAKAYAG